MDKRYKLLIARAAAISKERRVSRHSVVAEVGSALLTDGGNIYTGVNIECCCGIGFCAEHSAIAAMVTSGEDQIVAIVAVTNDGKVIPPCGRCREMLFQVNRDHRKTKVIVSEETVVPLPDLLKYR